METVSVLGAAFLHFFISCFWFGKISVSQKRRLEGSEIESCLRDPAPYLISFISSLWVSYGFFLIIKHVRPQSAIELGTLSIGLWLALIVGTSSKHYAFKGRAFRDCLKDYSIDLIGFILVAFVIW